MLFLNGIPFFFMEFAIGQWFSAGVIGVWKSVCPLMKGKRDSRSYKKTHSANGRHSFLKTRAAGEKVKLSKLEVKKKRRDEVERNFFSFSRAPPLFLVASLHALRACSRSTMTQKKRKRLLGVFN